MWFELDFFTGLICFLFGMFIGTTSYFTYLNFFNLI